MVAANSGGSVSGADQTFTTAAGGLTATPMRYVSNAPSMGTGPNTNAPPSILGFPAGAHGNLSPTVTISGPHTGLTEPVQLAVDASGNLFATDFSTGKVLEYGPGANGDVAPIAQIQLPVAGGGPVGIAASATGQLPVSGFLDPAVFVYARDAAGQWGLLHTITGANTGLADPAGVAFGPGGTIVVANELGANILQFAPGADGNVAPAGTITGSGTGAAFGVAVDAAGQIWVANFQKPTVSVFAPTASGNATPVRTIAGAATSFSQPASLALDGAGHVLVADGAGRVEDVSATANGNQAPFASLSGSQTGIVAAFGVAISPPLLGVSTASLPAATITTAYAQTVGARGGAPPYHFSIASGALPAGLALNAATGAINGTPTTAGTSSFSVKVTDASQPTSQSATQALSLVVRPPIVPSVFTTNGGSGTVTDYALTPLGNTSPLLTLGQGNKLQGPSGVTVNPTGRLYVANSGNNSISEFAPHAASTSGPDITISGANTGLDAPTSIALDAAGRIYVTSQSAEAIAVFAPGASGDATPIATISGSDSGLSGPAAATLTANGNLWVANASNNSLTEYAPGASGDPTPIATVSGPSTFLNMPVGIGQDEHGNLLVANMFGESIARFAPTANGNVAPDGLIQGVDTTLDFPRGVDVDGQGRIYVPNQFGNSITVFAPDATGDAIPVGTISGAATGLSGPSSVAVLPPLSILTRILPDGTVRHLYQTTLHAALGTAPYHWSRKRGHLPRGFRLSRDGALSGVPERTGRWTFTVAVTDSGHPATTDRHTLSLTVRCPLVGHARSCAITRPALRRAHAGNRDQPDVSVPQLLWFAP